MQSSESSSAPKGRWTSLWVVALLSLLGQLWLCQFFSFGVDVPYSIDINPSNLWRVAYTFPPTGSFQVVNWLGVAYLPFPLNPCSLALNLPPWLFFTTYAPVMGTCALLAMAAFLRELDLSRPAALFGGVIYAWQGDLLTFVLPGHYAYITTWPFFALAAWGALRAQRTRLWPYAVISGASCGLMVGLQPDRGGIACLLIAALYLAPTLRQIADRRTTLRQLALCVGVALLVSLGGVLALYKGNIAGVKLGGQTNRQESYKLVTQYSLGPEETLTYLAPGFFGWHMNSSEGTYWGKIGRTLDYPSGTNSTRNSNLAISTTGTIATLLALIGILVVLPGRWLGPSGITERQRFFGQVLLILGTIALVLSWGYHTPFYRPLFALPLMDKWRNPLKWLEMTNFALVTLSAFGVGHLQASLGPDSVDVKMLRRRLTWFCSVVLGILAIGFLATYPFALFSLKDYLLQAKYDSGAVANMIDTLIVSVRVALVLTGLFALLLWTLWRPEPLRRWELPNPLLHRIWQKMLTSEYLPLTLALALVVLSVAQLAWVDTKFIQPISLRLLTVTVPVLEKLKNEGPTVRVAVPVPDSVLSVLMLNQFYGDRISCLDISAASRIPDDLNAFLGAFDEAASRLWFLAGVKNVLVPQETMTQLQHDPDIASHIAKADGYTLDPDPGAQDMPTHALVQMKDYLAKATIVPHAEVIPTDEAMLKKLRDPAWNPRDSILLDPAHASAVKQVDMEDILGPPDKVNLKTYTPNDIVVEAQSAGGGYLLIDDQFDSDWQAQVNGKSAELLRADYILRAVAIPAGASTVSMHYAARYSLGGLKLPAVVVNNFSDLVMLAAWIVAGVVLLRRRNTGL